MSTTDQIALDRRLQELEDRQAITELIARLGQMLDDKRFDDAPSILADDVSVQTGGGAASGRDAVVAQARRTHTVTTQHVLTDVTIDVDGDHAKARANAIITFAPDAPGCKLTINDAEQDDPYLTLGEVYRFEARRTGDGWRLTRIEVRRSWSPKVLTGRVAVGQVEATAAR
jgi:hypothetical protein